MSQVDACTDDVEEVLALAAPAQEGSDTPPYGQYPTQTRFQRPDYKFYKTLDDSVEFAHRVQPPLPPPTPPPPPPAPPRRPATAYPAGRGFSHRPGPSGRCLHHRLPRDESPPLRRDPEPGWRPIYPEPDLSTPPAGSRRRPGTAPADRVAATTGSSSDAFGLRSGLLSAAPAVATAEPLKPPPPTPPPAAVAASTVTPLAVVDFLEDCTLRQPQPQPPPPPPTPPQTPAARFFRPKTAPARVDSPAGAAAGGGGGGGLQVLGRRLQPAERAASAKSPAVAASAAAVGVPQLSRAYDRALEVNGWRMEVPGDPYGIKRHYVPERKPINVTVPEPQVKPLPPRMRRSNRFTFFHTTAPRVVMSFDIHPNFTSEQYAKAKAALVRQGKWDFRYRDFSFMY